MWQNRTGLLIDYGHTEELAQALDHMASSPDLVQRLGTEARKLVARDFNWDIIGRKTAQVYLHLLAKAQD